MTSPSKAAGALRGLLLLALTAPALAAPAATPAQSVYRCGADGRQLQQQPCGDVRPAAVKPAPGAAERAAAAAVAARDARRADAMAAERLRREREQAKSAAPAVGIVGRAAMPDGAASAPKKTSKKAKPAA